MSKSKNNKSLDVKKTKNRAKKNVFARKKISIEKIILLVVILFLISSVFISLNKNIQNEKYLYPAGHIVPRLSVYNSEGVEIIFGNFITNDDDSIDTVFLIFNVNKYSVSCDVGLIQELENRSDIVNIENFKVLGREEKQVFVHLDELIPDYGFDFKASCERIS